MKKIVVILSIVFVLCILLLVMPSAAANITATVSQSTVAHGDKIFIIGTAEGQPNSVAIWILGKNFASRYTVAVNVDGSFSYEVTQQTTEALNSGHYFVVVQHPGTNDQYDIDWVGVPSQWVDDYSGQTPVSLFKIWGPGSLQGSDAANALEQGINKPSVDDTCTKIQFLIIPNLTATVSPSTVAQGHNIFINGTAEGQPNSVAIWILGTNFAQRSTVAVNVDGSFSYEIIKEVTKSLNSGHYFVVVQHPGTNDQYDIDWVGVPSQWVDDYSGQTPVSLFKIWGPGSLQGFDAFEALEQGINQPSVDDTYTALQFQIVSSSKIGVFQNGAWYLDANGNGAWDTGVDKAFNFGASGWTSVVGDWNGDSKTEIGIYQNGIWYLDYDGSGTWNAGDKVYFFGASGWTPIVGDWNATGFTYIGVTNGQQWYLDWNGNGVWDVGTDKAYSFGASGWTPVVGKWS